MPANDQRRPMSAMMRLRRWFTSWRERRAARRRAQLRGFMSMSDRMLADIGVRRADVHAALSGLVPVEQIARTRGGAPWTAPVHTLRPQARQNPGAFATNDLGAVA